MQQRTITMAQALQVAMRHRTAGRQGLADLWADIAAAQLEETSGRAVVRFRITVLPKKTHASVELPFNRRNK